MKTKSFTLRIPVILQEQYISIALKRGIKEKRIVGLSEVIIDALQSHLNNVKP